MTEQQRVIEEMQAIPGLYLCEDTNAPDKFVVIWSFRGRLYALAPTHTLDPDRFLPTAVFTTLKIAP